MEPIIIKNDKGEEKKFDIIASFTKDSIEYIIYTAYEKDELNSIKCYTSQNDNGKLLPITDEAVYDLVDEILDTLVETTNEKYQINGTN